VYAHSFWISEGQKMSKSLGNFIDLPALQGYVDRYGLDALRWFLVTRGPLDATDTDFRAAMFHDAYMAELVNTVGNCSSRVSAMITRTFEGRMPEDAQAGGEWPARCAAAVKAWETHIDRFELGQATAVAMGLLREVDGFINRTEPFKLAKDPARRGEVGSILAQCAETVRIAGVLLEPFLPVKTPELAAAFGGVGGSWTDRTRWGALKPGSGLVKVALYPRVETAPAA
jgi:methionyl-tRNA synthetase